MQLASCLKPGIDDRDDIQVGQCMAQNGFEVGWEASKGIVTTFEAMDEDEQQCSLWHIEQTFLVTLGVAER